MIDVIRTSNRLGVENFEQFVSINSCHVPKTIHLCRIYQVKSPIQPSNWNHLDVDEKLEQLVDINDTLFERIVIHS